MLRRIVAVVGVLVVMLSAAAGCSSSDPAGPTDGGSETSGNDAGNDAGNDGSPPGDADSGSTPAPPGFTIQSADIDLAPGQDVFTCYYFQAPNADAITIKSWESTLATGALHMSVLFTDGDRMAPGTVSSTDCGMVANPPNAPSWAYGTWKAQDGWTFPADDGAGNPVGKPIKAKQSGYLLIHAANPSATALKTHAELKVTGYPNGTVVTQAESYVTYDTSIAIPAGGSATPSRTCATPAGAKFNWLSTFAHKHAIHEEIKDGLTIVFETADWSNPGSKTTSAPPFPSFATNQVTVDCSYTNATSSQIVSGNAPDDERCMMLSYHFPATKPRLCLNGALLP